jgi:fatty acid desaturase
MEWLAATAAAIAAAAIAAAAVAAAAAAAAATAAVYVGRWRSAATIHTQTMSDVWRKQECHTRCPNKTPCQPSLMNSS